MLLCLLLHRRTSGDGSAPVTPAWASARQGSGSFLRPTSAKSGASEPAASTPSELQAVKEEPALQQPPDPAAVQGTAKPVKQETPSEPVILKAAVPAESPVIVTPKPGATEAGAADSETAATEHAAAEEKGSEPVEKLANGDSGAHAEAAAAAGKAEPSTEGVPGASPPASKDSMPSAAEVEEAAPASTKAPEAVEPDLAPSPLPEKVANGGMHAPPRAAVTPAPVAAAVARPDEVSSFRMARRKRTASDAAKSGPAADAAAAAALLSTPVAADGNGGS